MSYMLLIYGCVEVSFKLKQEIEFYSLFRDLTMMGTLVGDSNQDT